MAERTEGRAPRTPVNGYSERYEERRMSRGATKAYGPRWTDSAAIRLYAALEEDSAEQHVALEKNTTVLVQDARRSSALVARAAKNRGMSAVDQRCAFVQIAHVASRLRAAGDDADERLKAIRTFVNAMKARYKATRERLGELVVAPAVKGPPSFAQWLSRDWKSDYHHSIAGCNRILGGLERWYPRWLLGPGVICYERAAARVWDERESRGAPVGPFFLKGIVHQWELPTLTASPGNHYVVVEQGEEPRFMTVQEVARAFMVPEGGPLWCGLTSRVVSARDVVTLMGKGLHVGVARAILRPLVLAGVLRPGMTYGSAFSGIDMFAAAVDAEMEGRWTFEFACERDSTLEARNARKVLLSSWGRRGLTEARCHTDACSDVAVTEKHVTLWVATPDCKEHSAANRDPSEEAQATSMATAWRALEYVRRRRPTVVVVENVTNATVVPPMTGLLLRLERYRVWTAPLDPRQAADAPMARERQFWLLVAEEAGYTAQ